MQRLLFPTNVAGKRAFLPAVVVGGLLLGCSGYGEPGPVEFDASEDATIVGDSEASLLPFTCAGTILRTASIHFENSGSDAQPYTCVEQVGFGGESIRTTSYLVDAGRHAVEYASLRAADDDAFRDLHFRMRPDLEKKAAAPQSKNGLVTADVWFSRSDEAIEPSKAEILLLDENARKMTVATSRAATRREALRFADSIRVVAPSARLLRTPSGIAPMIQVEASVADLKAIGQMDGVTSLGLTLLPSLDKPAGSDVYYDIDKVLDLWNNGSFNGTNVKVIDVLSSLGVHDTTNLNLAPGDCEATFGPNYACPCPTDTRREGPGGHPQDVLGMLSNRAIANPRGGTSKFSIGLVGAINDRCELSATGQSTVEWGLDQGANIVNRSAANTASFSLFLDFVSAQSPFPLIVASAGNSSADPVASRIRNGLVVGAADDKGDPSRDNLKTIASFSQWKNFSGGADGYEVPHIVAPGKDVHTTPAAPGQALRTVSGTSFAAPQVSGIAADLMEEAPILKTWPEAAMAIIIASPGQGVDGTWPLKMNDGVDDKSGAGAVNGRIARLIAANQVNNDNAAIRSAFSFGNPIAGTTTQAIAVHRARASAGRTLRVVVDFFSRCGSSQCTSPTYPAFQVTISSSQMVPPTRIFQNLNSNYLYAAVTNSGTTTRDYTIGVFVTDWRGMSSDTYGIAWSSLNDDE